jgi:hypothetical protein
LLAIYSFYFFILEKIDLLDLLFPDLELGEGEAQETMEIVSASLPKAPSHCSIEF